MSITPIEKVIYTAKAHTTGVKDSKKYHTTGGWGFAQFKDGKPDSSATLKTCFPCHEPAKARDFAFTHYAP